MKISKILAVSSFMLVFAVNLSAYQDYDNPPNPSDAKEFKFTIVNKIDMSIKVSFFYGQNKHYKGVIIEAGKPYTFENIEGRYNRKDSYFRFRKPGTGAKGTGVKFYYKRAGKARGAKIDMVYLLTDENENFIISASEEINPATTILKADINQKLAPEKTKKHKKTRRDEKASKRKKHKASRESVDAPVAD